jgi:hypothetical protein
MSRWADTTTDEEDYADSNPRTMSNSNQDNDEDEDGSLKLQPEQVECKSYRFVVPAILFSIVCFDVPVPFCSHEILLLFS